jgi:hypothetical protein
MPMLSARSEMTTTSRTITSLCGVCLVAGSSLGSVLSTAPAAAAAPAPLVLRMSATPTVAGRQTTLTLAVKAPSGATVGHLAVSDLLPAGVAYVPGCARLTTASGTAALADPQILVPPGRATAFLLVWANLPAPARGIAVTFRVRPEQAPTAAGGFGAGRVWSSTGAAYADSGSAVPAFDPAGNLVAGSADETASARIWLRVVPLGVAESAVAGPGDSQTDALRVTATRSGPTDGVVLRAYLPAGVTFVGGAPGEPGTAPVVSTATLPVRVAEPFLPLAFVAVPPPPMPIPATTGLSPTSTAPTSTTTTPPTTAPPTTVGPEVQETFTVLTWDLGTVAPGAEVAEDYRIARPASATGSRGDVVTASGTTTADPTSAPELVTSSAFDRWAALPHPIAVADPGPLGAELLGGARTVAATSPPAPPHPAGGAVHPGSTRGTGRSVEEKEKKAADRNPFGSVGATTTTVRARTTAAERTARTPGTQVLASASPADTAPLAYTGIDAVAELRVALVVLAAGIAVVLADRRRHRYRPAHLRRGRVRPGR